MKKNILIGLGGIIFLGGLFFFLGKNFEFLGFKEADNLQAYLPSGYEISKNSEVRESDIGKIYETLLVKGDKSIKIVKTNKYPFECQGENRKLGGENVCYSSLGENPNLPDDIIAVSWSSEDSDYQLTTNDLNLGEKELAELIHGFKNVHF